MTDGATNLFDMLIRPAKPDDHHDAIGWLRSDDPARALRVLVEEDSQSIIGAVMRMPNPLHPELDHLEVATPGSATEDLLTAVAALEPNDVLMRAIPGTPEHRLALAAGAAVLECVPAARIDPTDPAVIQWAAEHHGEARPGTDYPEEALAELWIKYYVASHQHFGVTTDQELLRARLGAFVSRALDRTLTRIVEEDGRLVALAVVFREGPGLMGLVDSLTPDEAGARRHVEIAMAALLQAMPSEPFELDGHASGKHYPAVLATIPNVTCGPLTPMELLRL